MQTSTANKKILVVDDEERMLRFIRLNLEHDGFQVIEAIKGIPLVEMVRFGVRHVDHPNDVMPGFDWCRNHAANRGWRIFLFKTDEACVVTTVIAELGFTGLYCQAHERFFDLKGADRFSRIWCRLVVALPILPINADNIVQPPFTIEKNGAAFNIVVFYKGFQCFAQQGSFIEQVELQAAERLQGGQR